MWSLWLWNQPCQFFECFHIYFAAECHVLSCTKNDIIADTRFWLLCAWFIRNKFVMYLVWLVTISPPYKWQHCTHILYEPECGTCLLFCTHIINQWLCATYCFRHFPSFTGLAYILHYCVLSLTNCEIFSPVTCLNFTHISLVIRNAPVCSTFRKYLYRLQSIYYHWLQFWVEIKVRICIHSTEFLVASGHHRKDPFILKYSIVIITTAGRSHYFMYRKKCVIAR